MSLAKRLSVTANRSNRGCVTCAWLKTLSEEDYAAWVSWIEEKKSISQLWEIASGDPDNPLPVSPTGLRNHLRHGKEVVR